MRAIIVIIFAIMCIGTCKAQDVKLELSLSGSSFAISNGLEAYSSQAAQLSLGYDLFNKGFMFAPEVDVNWVFNAGDIVFRVVPGIKLGHNNFYTITSYDLNFDIPYYGIGGLIPVTKNGSGISLKVQVGIYKGFPVGYASFGYTFKIK